MGGGARDSTCSTANGSILTMFVVMELSLNNEIRWRKGKRKR